MTTRRKPNEKDADSFDCDLAHLIDRAERLVREDQKWREAMLILMQARAPVRSMMHYEDREKTT